MVNACLDLHHSWGNSFASCFKIQHSKCRHYGKVFHCLFFLCFFLFRPRLSGSSRCRLSVIHRKFIWSVHVSKQTQSSFSYKSKSLKWSTFNQSEWILLEPLPGLLWADSKSLWSGAQIFILQPSRLNYTKDNIRFKKSSLVHFPCERIWWDLLVGLQPTWALIWRMTKWQELIRSILIWVESSISCDLSWFLCLIPKTHSPIEHHFKHCDVMIFVRLLGRRKLVSSWVIFISLLS